MDLEQTSDPGHTMKYKEKVPRDFQEKTLLKIDLGCHWLNLRLWASIS